MEIQTPKAEKIRWYRTPLKPEDLKAVLARSDLKGFLQAGGYLGFLVLSGGAMALVCHPLDSLRRWHRHVLHRERLS